MKVGACSSLNKISAQARPTAHLRAQEQLWNLDQFCFHRLAAATGVISVDQS